MEECDDPAVDFIALWKIDISANGHGVPNLGGQCDFVSSVSSVAKSTF